MTNLANGRYRHFKGREYELLGVACHSETGEEFVVYRPLYGGYSLTVRPRAMFEEIVTRAGRTQPRFVFVGPPDVRKLTWEAQQRARSFLLEKGRELEQALYHHFFENGAHDPAYTALAAYGNEDGGFGHALEPDLQTPDSSVLATTVALQTLRDLKTPGHHPLVTGALGFLAANYDEEQRRWPIIPATANNAPHAPWWAIDADLPERFGGYLLNPRAEVLAYLYEYAAQVEPNLLRQVTESFLAHIASLPEPMNVHDFLCCERLLATAGLPDSVRLPLAETLTSTLDQSVEYNPPQWATYCLQPLAAAPTPASPLAARLADLLPANLDHLIANQGEDGAWAPNWSWLGAFPDAWPAAELAWKSALTLAALRQLAAYGRLAL